MPLNRCSTPAARGGGLWSRHWTACAGRSARQGPPNALQQWPSIWQAAGRVAEYSRRIDWLARAGSWLVRLLGVTWRFRVVNDAPVRAARAAKQPLIFALWHGQLLPLLYHHRNEG